MKPLARDSTNLSAELSIVDFVYKSNKVAHTCAVQDVDSSDGT